MSGAISDAFMLALGWHEAFRKLGFLPDELYVGIDDRSIWLVVLKAQGRDFTVEVARVRAGGSLEELYDQWGDAVLGWNTASPEQRSVIYAHWLTENNGVDLVARLIAKGFDLHAARSRPEWQALEITVTGRGARA